MARRKLTKAERERFDAERELAHENAGRLLEVAKRAQAKLDAQRNRAAET